MGVTCFWLVLEAVCVFRGLTSAQGRRLLLQRSYEVYCCSLCLHAPVRCYEGL